MLSLFWASSRLIGFGLLQPGLIPSGKGRVGHANASTTLDVYAHFLPSADKLAADSAGSVLDLATSEGRAKGAKGGKRGATGSELTELDNTVRPYSPENKDITTQEKPNNSGSPGART